MIVLADEGQSFRIARAEAGEALAGLELEIDLVADEAVQLVNLVTVVDGNPNAAVDDAPHRYRLRRCRHGIQQGGHGDRGPPDPLRDTPLRDTPLRDTPNSHPTVHGATPSRPVGRREPRVRI